MAAQAVGEEATLAWVELGASPEVADRSAAEGARALAGPSAMAEAEAWAERRGLEAAKAVAAAVAVRAAVQVERRAWVVWVATRAVAVPQLAVVLGQVDVAAGWAELGRRSLDTWILLRSLGDLRYWLSFAGAGSGSNASRVESRWDRHTGRASPVPFVGAAEGA